MYRRTMHAWELEPEPIPEPELELLGPRVSAPARVQARCSYLQLVQASPSLAPAWTNHVQWARRRPTLLQAAQRRLAWAEVLLPIPVRRALDWLVSDMVEMVGGQFVIGLMFPQSEPCVASMIAAIKASDETELLLLLASSADVNGVDLRPQHAHRGASGGTALLAACLHNNVRAVQILVKHGAEVDKSDEIGGWSPLMVAAGSGYTGAVHELLSAGADWRRKTHLGETALDWARVRGKTDTVAEIENWASREAPNMTSA